MVQFGQCSLMMPSSRRQAELVDIHSHYQHVYVPVSAI